MKQRQSPRVVGRMPTTTRKAIDVRFSEVYSLAVMLYCSVVTVFIIVSTDQRLFSSF